MPGELSWLAGIEVALRLVMAAGCGAILGWDREVHDKPAGLRTHMMVALGSAVFVLVAIDMERQFSNSSDSLTIDPSRVLAGVVGGIGFLGAGTIIQKRGDVQGITTAASIWVVAATGVASAIGSYFIAIIAVVLSVAILSLSRIANYRALVNHAGRPANKSPGS